MSLQPVSIYTVPEQTARVARSAFPQSSLCMRLYNQLGTIFEDQDFADLFPKSGQPGQSPFRLALVTILQFLEGLSDRNAANAVGGRIDWKYLLCLELEDAGFDYSVLCEFRSRLLEGGVERRLFDKVLSILREQKLVKERTLQRTDSTHVLAAVRDLNRLERVVETLRAALNVLATVDPDWVIANIPVEWLDRYGKGAEEYRLPAEEKEREKFAEQVGRDGNALLDAIWSGEAPATRCKALSLIISTMLAAQMSLASYAQQAYQFGKCEVAPANREAALRSVYIAMPDGVKIAADVILPRDLPADTKLPTVLTQTRYWRATEGRQPTGADRYWINHGYAVVNTDVRGTGASFGRWPAPWARDEVRDTGDTEGMLRAIHRKISSEPQPYKLPIPYHSFKRKDAQPLVVGQTGEITFGLYPTSVLIKKGHRIRVAIAGADKDTFVRLPAEGTPVISVARNNATPRSLICLL